MSYYKVSQNMLTVKKKKINVNSNSAKLWYVYANGIKVGEINGSHSWVKRKQTDRVLTKQKWLYSTRWDRDGLKKLFKRDFSIGSRHKSGDFEELSRYPSAKDIFNSMDTDLHVFNKGKV